MKDGVVLYVLEAVAIMLVLAGLAGLGGAIYDMVSDDTVCTAR